MTEERRVVTSDPVEEVDTVPSDTVEKVETTNTVVERRPVENVVERRPLRRTVVTDGDPVGSAYASSAMIQTIVWAIVILVLLVVILLALHVYAGLF